MRILLALAVVLSACLGVTWAVKCYACTYTNVVPDYNSFCGEKFDANLLLAASSVVECDGVCVKSSGEVMGVMSLERKCDANQTMAECSNACGKVEGASISGCMHCCDTDLCNGAGSVTFDMLMLPAILVTAGAFMNFYIVIP